MWFSLVGSFQVELEFEVLVFVKARDIREKLSDHEQQPTTALKKYKYVCPLISVMTRWFGFLNSS